MNNPIISNENFMNIPDFEETRTIIEDINDLSEQI